MCVVPPEGSLKVTDGLRGRASPGRPLTLGPTGAPYADATAADRLDGPTAAPRRGSEGTEPTTCGPTAANGAGACGEKGVTAGAPARRPLLLLLRATRSSTWGSWRDSRITSCTSSYVLPVSECPFHSKTSSPARHGHVSQSKGKIGDKNGRGSSHDLANVNCKE